ncbi:MAG: cell wall hydrolase [Myxococcota bacterium]
MLPPLRATLFCLLAIPWIVVAPTAEAGAAGIDAAQAECLALAMYFEARAEGREGMRAVGHVILNRRDDARFPGSVCGVVQQGGEGRGCQFSWYCDGRSDVPTHRRAWRAAGALAYQLLADRLEDTTGGALFYHATWIDVPWKRPREKTRVIGNHAFYR